MHPDLRTGHVLACAVPDPGRRGARGSGHGPARRDPAPRPSATPAPSRERDPERRAGPDAGRAAVADLELAAGEPAVDAAVSGVWYTGAGCRPRRPGERCEAGRHARSSDRRGIRQVAVARASARGGVDRYRAGQSGEDRDLPRVSGTASSTHSDRQAGRREPAVRRVPAAAAVPAVPAATSNSLAVTLYS